MGLAVWLDGWGIRLGLAVSLQWRRIEDCLKPADEILFAGAGGDVLGYGAVVDYYKDWGFLNWHYGLEKSLFLCADQETKGDCFLR
jgi:hypothetical protein